VINLFVESTLISFQDLFPNQINQFDCDNKDLNDFFRNDSQIFNDGLMGKTYAFILDKEPKNIICAFTVSNDSIKANHFPNARKKKLQKKVSHSKVMRSYPAVMIGRLGVSKQFHKAKIGSQLMDFIKYWFSERSNKTGCRFIVVDSYNNNGAITYYAKNGFEFLFSTEQQEKEYLTLDDSVKLMTRLMFFDLISLKV